MLCNHETEVEIEVRVIKGPYGTEGYTCNGKCLNESIRTSWRGSNILVTGLPGIGKTSLCMRLARELSILRECRVHKFENINELHKSDHFINSHENHELIILVDNATSSELHELTLTHKLNTTAIIFSRALLVDNFDCVIEIKGSYWQTKPLTDNDSSWNSHIKTLCSIPFLFVLSKSLFSKNMSSHDVYFLLLASYVNYCQTLQVSLFTYLKEVPEKVEKLLKCLVDIAYSCLHKGTKFVDENQLKKLCDDRDDVGVVTRTGDGRWRFTFDGSAECLAAFKLYWISKEQFAKDTGDVKLPLEAVKLFEGVCC